MNQNTHNTLKKEKKVIHYDQSTNKIFSMTPDSIKEKIEQQLPGSIVTVQSADNIHYHATVKSPHFRGLNTLQQHREVYKALHEELKEKIHALQLTTLAIQE